MTRNIAIWTIILTLWATAARADYVPRLSLTQSLADDAEAGSGDNAEEPAHHRGGSGGGSLIAGKTLGGGDAILAQFGWPGISVGYLHAQSSNLDVGGTFTFNYGREGLVEIDPGIKLQGALRLSLMDNGKLNFGLRFDPGLAMYFDEADGEGFGFGITLPAALTLGVAAGDALMLDFGFDFPMLIRIAPTDFVRVELPFLFGVGMEYRVDSHLSLTFDCRFGPDVLAYNHYSDTRFAFRALVGIGYRL